MTVRMEMSWMGEGKCRVCPIGTYRKQGVQIQCTQCSDSSKTTATNGSVTEAQCNIIACLPGQMRINKTHCEPCPMGTYQPKKWQTKCISCGDLSKWRTDGVASVIKSDCKYKKCEPLALMEPSNVNKVCSDVKGADGVTIIGKKCDMTCKSGVFYKQSSPIVYNCDMNTGSWSPSTLVPACVSTQEAVYTMKYKLQYTFSSITQACVDQYSNAIKAKLHTVTNSLTTECSTYSSTVAHEGNVEVQIDQPNSTIYFTITIIIMPNAGSTSCASVVAALMLNIQNNIPAFQSSRPLNSVVVAGCGTLTFISDPNFKLMQDSICQPGLLKQQSGSSFFCVPCPPGTMSKKDTCEPCPIGYYQDQDSQSMCVRCPNGTNTYNVSSNSLAQCMMECTPGTYYDNMAKTCILCPVGQYQDLTKQTSCKPCGAKMTTARIGSEAASKCITSPHQSSSVTVIAIGTVVAGIVMLTIGLVFFLLRRKLNNQKQQAGNGRHFEQNAGRQINGNEATASQQSGNTAVQEMHVLPSPSGAPSDIHTNTHATSQSLYETIDRPESDYVEPESHLYHDLPENIATNESSRSQQGAAYEPLRGSEQPTSQDIYTHLAAYEPLQGSQQPTSRGIYTHLAAYEPLRGSEQSTSRDIYTHLAAHEPLRG